jgi:NAD(P)-dependent dehydrogenase (short-subunit alcohol dehydrogenase family)
MPPTQPRTLQGQKALVTGATSGIGRAVALQLARDGAEVIVHGRDAARGTETVASITAAGGRARFVSADLSDPAALQRLVDAVGDIDVLVNNAGFSWFGATADLDVATFDALFASNVRAPFFLVAAFAPGMATRGKGSIINVSSMAGQIGLAGGAAYGATKAALASMTRAWAAEFSPSGVRVNAIAPGPVYTGGAAPERIEALGSTARPTPQKLRRLSHSWLHPAPVTSPARSSPPTAAAPRPSTGAHAASDRCRVTLVRRRGQASLSRELPQHRPVGRRICWWSARSATTQVNRRILVPQPGVRR